MNFARIGFAVACVIVVALEWVAFAGWRGWVGPRHVAVAIAPSPVAAPVIAAATPVLRAAPEPQEVQAPLLSGEEAYFARLRNQLRWVPTRIGDLDLMTPDLYSRVLLAKSAAERARLEEVGLGFRDVYGIINAETSWVPRRGASKDGTPNLGIAQFEPATARALRLRNPNDPVEAVHAAAMHMREAALWSEARIAGLKLSALERGIKLREGVSIYYNLSSRGRSAWNGRNTRYLPRETQLHILNARIGARQADVLEAQLRSGDIGVRDRGFLPAGLTRGG